MKTYEKISVGKAKNKWDFPEARKCLKHTQRATVAGPWTLSEEGDEDRDIVIDFLWNPWSKERIWDLILITKSVECVK